MNAMILAAVTPEAPGWMGSAMQFGALGIVAWIVYYVFSKGLPEMNKRHADEMTIQRDSHARESAALRETHTAAVIALTNAQLKESSLNREVLAGSLKSFREELQMERLACTTERTLDREARHAVANSLNAVSLSLVLLHESYPEIKKAHEARLAEDVKKREHAGG